MLSNSFSYSLVAASGAHDDANPVTSESPTHPPAVADARVQETPRGHSDGPDKIAHLRQLIAATEKRGLRSESCRPQGDGAQHTGPVWTTGVAEIDQALPHARLSQTGVHEVSGASHGETVTASAYLTALLKQLCNATHQSMQANAHLSPRRQVLWCQTKTAAHEFGVVHGAGLHAFGFDPADILFVHAEKNRDVLWALEEGARSAALLAVVGEVDALSFTQSRRLTLAAMTGATPVLLVRPYHDQTASAAETRWRLTAKPGASDPFVPNAPGNPRWQVALTRCRGGRTGSWDVEWNHETHRLHLVEHLCTRLPQAVDPPHKAERRRGRITAALKSFCSGC